jgi:hypothetical protein
MSTGCTWYGYSSKFMVMWSGYVAYVADKKLHMLLGTPLRQWPLKR